MTDFMAIVAGVMYALAVGILGLRLGLRLVIALRVAWERRHNGKRKQDIK